MSRPLFYAVREITRGPRGALQDVRVIVTRQGKGPAISRARAESRVRAGEVDVVGIGIETGKFVVVSKAAAFRNGRGGHAVPDGR